MAMGVDHWRIQRTVFKEDEKFWRGDLTYPILNFPPADLGHFIFKKHNFYISILFIIIFILVRSSPALRAALTDLSAEGPSLTISLTSRRLVRTLRGCH